MSSSQRRNKTHDRQRSLIIRKNEEEDDGSLIFNPGDKSESTGTTKRFGSGRSNLSESSISSSIRSSSRLSELSERSLDERVLRSSCLKDNKNIESLTINKLNYKAIPLIGRQSDNETLHRCIDQLTTNSADHRKELIFIKGYSGTGKTAVIANLAQEVERTIHGAMFVRGKFNWNDYDEPYSAISEAFSEICRRIPNSFGFDRKEKNEISLGETIIAEMGPGELQALALLIPELLTLIPSNSMNNFAIRYSLSGGQERWKYAFRVLARILSSYCSPLVLIFDDIQWADASSLDVIDYLITDTQNKNPLMIIGCYRLNEVDDDHILSKKVHSLEEKKDQFKFHITDIELQNLQDVNQVNKIIMAMLSIDSEDYTKSLAEICYERTHGNPYFVIEFMTMLQFEGLINFNLGLLKWVWDKESIEHKTMSTANVVDTLQARMRALPRHVQLLLQYAACLSSFNVSTLELVWPKEGFRKTSVLLAELEKEQFIEKHESAAYRWVHDKVQEAAMSLGDVDKRLLQFEIGNVLYHSLMEAELEESLFDVVDLINKGKIKEKQEYALLNLRAAEKAKSMSAFQSASAYVAKGIRLLPRDKWSPLYREVTLRLYTLGAQMELALGRVEVMETYSKEVLSQESCTTLEKVPLHIATASKLHNVDLNHKDAIYLFLSVLKDLDCKLVRNRALLPFQALHSLNQTIKLITNAKEGFFSTLKTLDDPKQKAIGNILAKIQTVCYFSNFNPFLLVLATTRLTQITVDVGLHDLSGFALSTLGILAVAIKGDFETASFLSETAELLQTRAESQYSEAYTIHANNNVLPWTRPLQSFVAPSLKGYRSGMRSGNVEYALWSLVSLQVWIPFMTGNPLERMLEKFPDCQHQILETKFDSISFPLIVMWQIFLNLTGRSGETTRLHGNIFSCEGFVCANPNQKELINYAKMELYLYFGDYEHAAEQAIETGGKFAETFPSFVLIMMETFHRGVALYVMARRTRKLKYIRQAKRVRKTIKGWVKAGNPNVHHYLLLLNAEQAAYKRDFPGAYGHYKKATTLAARMGYIHDAALFNELFADLLSQGRDVSGVFAEEKANYYQVSDTFGGGDPLSAVALDELKYRVSKSIRYYSEWGAVEKVRLLRERYFLGSSD